MKKGIVVLLILSFMLSTMAFAFAATDINEAEQRILDRLEEGVVVGDSRVHAPEEVINAAEIFFIRDEVDFTMEDADVVIKAIDQIAEVIKAAGVTNIADLSAEDKIRIVELAKEGAEAVTSMNLTLSYDFETNIVTILDRDTNEVLAQVEVFSVSGPIKQTGFTMASTMGVAVLLTGAIIGSLVIAKKKKLFSEEA